MKNQEKVECGKRKKVKKARKSGKIKNKITTKTVKYEIHIDKNEKKFNNSNMKCILVGGGEFEPKEFVNDGAVIAVDGGYDYIKDICAPIAIVGDLDSIKSEISQNATIERFSAQKDYTDMQLAIEYGLSKGYDEFTIYGALGGRLDHTIGNLQIASNFHEKGYKVTLVGANENIYFVSNEKVIKNENVGYVSVFSLKNSARVTLEGMKYPLKKYLMSNQFPIGVSNEIVGEQAKISVSEGTVVVVVNKK